MTTPLDLPLVPVLFRFRRSYLATMNVLDISGFYSMGVFLNVFPWRGLLLSLGFIALYFWLGLALTMGWELQILVLLLAIPPAIELWNRRDYLTPTALGRQSGVLGRRCRVVPLAAIESVQVSYQRFGRYFNVGDVIVSIQGGQERLAGIKAPEEAARYILHVKAAQ